VREADVVPIMKIKSNFIMSSPMVYYEEFLVQALPCYLFYAAFTLRILAIRHIGLSKQRRLPHVIVVRALLTLGLLAVRIGQAVTAFLVESYWLSHKPWLSLLYLQFIGAYICTLILLREGYRKRLPEPLYCLKLFWILSFGFTIVCFKLKEDLVSKAFDSVLLVLSGCLVGTLFVK